MNMKALRVASGCLLLAVGTAGCDITEYNPGGLTSETVFTNPDGFESLVNAAYAYTRWWYGKEEGISMSELGTDLWTSGAGDAHPSLTTYQDLQSNQRAVDQLWQHLYTAVNLVNAGINGIDESGLSAKQKSTRLAELRFLRAFYYWHIAETWGGVHFSLDETRGIVTTANRTPVDKFYEQIFQDLDYAVGNLPTTTSDYGRVTKPAAEAFLARMYLTRGRNKEAFDMATKVINSYNFQLLPRYADLWRMNNLQNREVVWAVNYSANIALNDKRDRILFPGGHPRGGNNSHLFFLMVYDRLPGMRRDIANGRPFNRYMPTRYLLDLFDETRDSRYDASFQTVWYANNSKRPAGVALGDTAVLATKHEVSAAERSRAEYRIFDRSDIYRADGSPAQRLYYPSLEKFIDPTRPTVQEQVSGRDAFVIRLAEMYLIAAEAQLKLNNPALAAQYVNAIRERAALPGKKAEMRVSPADITIDFILDERARELAGEQIRWFDLKRTGKLVERVRRYNPDAAPYVQGFNLLRPIPQRQLDAVTNKDEFTQNPGYN